MKARRSVHGATIVEAHALAVVVAAGLVPAARAEIGADRVLEAALGQVRREEINVAPADPRTGVGRAEGVEASADPDRKVAGLSDAMNATLCTTVRHRYKLW